MYRIVLLIVAIASLLFIGVQVQASGFGLKDTATKAGYETSGEAASVTGRIQTIVSAILGFVALLFFGLTLYGGLTWLTARGKEDKITEAKGILEAAAIGLVIIAASYAIANFILGRISQSAVGCCSYTTEAGMEFTNISKEECDTHSGDWSAGDCGAI